MMSDGRGGAVCVCCHKPRANFVLLKVLELISQQKHIFPDHPTKTCFFPVSDSAAALAGYSRG